MKISEISELGVYAGPLEKSCAKFGITAPANFLGQCAHESKNFRRVRESLDYAADKLQGVFGESRITTEQAWKLGRVDAAVRARTGSKAADQNADRLGIASVVYGGTWGVVNLGNRLGSRDASMFIGRGLIQVTGYSNYAACSQALFGDARLLDSPHLLEQPEWAAMSAAWFYTSRGLHKETDMRVITKRINTGMLGLEDRIEKAEHFRRLLG